MRLSDTRHRWLVVSLLRRRLAERYRGSVLGVAWAVVLPLGMLAVYTFFFRHLLAMRWPGNPGAGDLEVAVRIFVGLTFVGFMGEVLTGAPRLVLEQPAYVKKIQFPLPVLAYVHVGAAFTQALLALGVAAAVALVGGIGRPWALPLATVYCIPLLLWALALAWALAAVGIYLRDLQHMMSPIVTALLFLSPVFYSVAALPAQWHALIAANPLTLPIEGARAVLLGDVPPAWTQWLTQFAVACCAVIIGRWLFDRVQPGFADAL
ncbi:Teichoic acid translocation permease protein TagG [Tepidimonas thermarum]|uniref:Transport permease protein n=1 Tax=Tepidimonas thermarum TaxID=335431 RepID=A0A554WYU6_9BURK|nr:ABC transporter permease [Tepidimonas thermarum]TSE28753.1 Teichoic acid translocation permease protein TagG [Tepidimonas thermarum]